MYTRYKLYLNNIRKTLVGKYIIYSQTIPSQKYIDHKQVNYYTVP